MKPRYNFIDFLRFIAIFGVILQHSASGNLIPLWNNVDGECGRIVESIKAISRYNILVFLFISGYLLIPKKISISIMWRKYIKRIFLVFTFWSILYSIYNILFIYLPQSSISLSTSAKLFLGDVISGGQNRMWYLVMLMGMYAFIPVISCVFADEGHKTWKYFTWLMIVIVSFLPTISSLPMIGTVVSLNVDRILPVFPGILTLYVVLGGYFSKSNLKFEHTSLVLILLSIFSLFLIFILTMLGYSIDINSILYLIVVVGIVTYGIFKYDLWPEWSKLIVKSISECSFGIYLVHTFIQYVLSYVTFDELLSRFFPIILSVILYTITVCGFSWIVVLLLRKTKFGRLIA